MASYWPRPGPVAVGSALKVNWNVPFDAAGPQELQLWVPLGTGSTTREPVGAPVQTGVPYWRRVPRPGSPTSVWYLMFSKPQLVVQSDFQVALDVFHQYWA